MTREGSPSFDVVDVVPFQPLDRSLVVHGESLAVLFQVRIQPCPIVEHPRPNFHCWAGRPSKEAQGCHRGVCSRIMLSYKNTQAHTVARKIFGHAIGDVYQVRVDQPV